MVVVPVVTLRNGKCHCLANGKAAVQRTVNVMYHYARRTDSIVIYGGVGGCNTI